jgi:hypothetical protein
MASARSDLKPTTIPSGRVNRSNWPGKATELLRRREVPIPEKLKFVTRKSNLWKPI